MGFFSWYANNLSLSGKLVVAGLGAYAFGKYLEKRANDLDSPYWDPETVIPQLTAEHMRALNEYMEENNCSFLEAVQVLCDEWNRGG